MYLYSFFGGREFLVKNCFKYVARHKGLTVKALFRHFVCLVLCFISLFPICILIINSTKSTHEIISGLSFLPGGDFAENFAEAKGILYSYGLNLYTVIGRSCLISVTCSVVGTYIGAMCAYGFEYYNFKGKNTLWWPVFASMMIPAVAGAVGYIKFVYKFHMYNHYYPIILVGIVIPSCVYFLRMYFHAFRLNEIIEAARIDGCNEFKIFNKIIVPMIKPAILLQLIFNFATNWNNTIYQKLVLLDVKKKTISIFLNLFAGYNGASTDPGLFCFLLASTIPSFVVYILFSSGIMSRINIGSIKE